MDTACVLIQPSVFKKIKTSLKENHIQGASLLNVYILNTVLNKTKDVSVFFTDIFQVL